MLSWLIIESRAARLTTQCYFSSQWRCTNNHKLNATSKDWSMNVWSRLLALTQIHHICDDLWYFWNPWCIHFTYAYFFMHILKYNFFLQFDFFEFVNLCTKFGTCGTKFKCEWSQICTIWLFDPKIQWILHLHCYNDQWWASFFGNP